MVPVALITAVSGQWLVDVGPVDWVWCSLLYRPIIAVAGELPAERAGFQ